MHVVTHGQHSVVFCEDLERTIPDSDSKASREYYGHVHVAHRNMMAIRGSSAMRRVQNYIQVARNSASAQDVLHDVLERQAAKNVAGAGSRNLSGQA